MDMKKLTKQIDWFLDVFGPERFYLEVQPEDQATRQNLNQKLYDMERAKKALAWLQPATVITPRKRIMKHMK